MNISASKHGQSNLASKLREERSVSFREQEIFHIEALPCQNGLSGPNKTFGLTHTRNLTKPDMHRLQVGPIEGGQEEWQVKMDVRNVSCHSQVSHVKLLHKVFGRTHEFAVSSHASYVALCRPRLDNELCPKLPKTEATLQAKRIQSHWYCWHLAPTNVHIEVWPHNV